MLGELVTDDVISVPSYAIYIYDLMIPLLVQ